MSVPPVFRAHADGSFDIAAGNLSIGGAFPAFDGVPLRPVKVDVRADRVEYLLREGRVILAAEISDGSLRLKSRIEGIARAPHWFLPVAGARVCGARRVFRTGAGFSGPTNIVDLPEDGTLFSADSYLMTGLVGADGDSMVFGVADQRQWLAQCRVFNRVLRGNFRNREVRDSRFGFEAGFSMEQVALDRAGVDLPDWTVRSGDRLWGTLRGLAETMARERAVALRHPPSYHYCSWYRRGAHTTLDDLTSALDAASASGERYRYIQIDDGYALAAGDWLDADEKKWPGGLPRAFAEIRRRGFRPGVWVAPYMVASRSRLYREHPDWVIRAPDGAPLVEWRDYLGTRESEEHYALDTSHPEAFAYIRSVFRTFRGWGAEFFKTDFMEWGFKDSTGVLRRVPGKTSAAYHDDVCRAIREEIGDAYWLGCIAYFAPCLGYVDGMRVGSDVGDQWAGSGGTGNDGVGGGTENAVAEIVGCHPFNRIFWENDPDVLFLRRRYCRLAEGAVRALAYWNGILGVSLNTSDAPNELEPDRLALWRFLRPGREPVSAEMPFWEDHASGDPKRPVFVAGRSYGEGRWAICWLNSSNREQIDHATASELVGSAEIAAFEWGPEGAKPLGSRAEFVVRLRGHEAILLYLSANGLPPPDGMTLGGAFAE